MPLEKSQLRELEKVLDRQYVTLLEEIRKELIESEHHQYAELVGRGGVDSGEEAVGDILADLNVAMFDRHIRELRQIESARTRMREQDFGVCVDCGEDIRFERLQVQPAATRCIDCQKQHDRLFGGNLTPSM